MYDGINSDADAIARNFPHAAIIAGYANGTYAWTAGDWGRFPHARHVTVTVTASANAGDVLDVEKGDATPDQAPAWIRMRRQAGLYRPTIYCSRSVIPEVRKATGSLVLGRDYDLWAADYTGVPHQVTAPGPGNVVPCAVTQYASHPDYDISAVYDSGWPHRTAPSPSAWTFPAVRDLKLTGTGPHSVSVSVTSPGGGPRPLGVSYYQVNVSVAGMTGNIPGYPRHIPKSLTGATQEWQGGGLTPATSYVMNVRPCASGADTHAGPWVPLSFTTPRT